MEAKMDSFKLKITAIISMFLDHINWIFNKSINMFSYIGRLAFPIFAFQASIGYSHTKNIKKYIIRLFIFALLSQIPFSLYFNIDDLNVIFTILFGIISIFIYEKCTSKKLLPLGLLAVTFIGFLSELLKTDFGCYGVFLIFLFYIAKNNKIVTIIGFFLLTTLFFFNKMLLYGIQETIIYRYIFTLLSLIPILLYNQKEGRKIKYLFYFFYPLHLVLLYLIKIFI